MATLSLLFATLSLVCLVALIYVAYRWGYNEGRASMLMEVIDRRIGSERSPESEP